ncbi:MAG: TolC family protein [Methylicorpusculum sp.]|uniref:TolC family protein n=1 Tax=Methylicorpusculum sp. TaxID=2713644 RepID=UPI00272093B4|nr:TolC family protein [Methylicorpusculum sp.]MDO8939054.1 TolC family protein [Methylicorpusculum sp.]MDP2202929.1 TolC family protein [Methylicorpusculum sp.]
MLSSKPGLRISLLGGLLLIPVASTSAETLEEAWDIAIENNHQIKAAQADTTATEQNLFSAQGQRLPELNIGTGYTQLNETPAAKANFAGQSAEFNTSQAGSMNAHAIASVPVFTSGRISHNIKAAEAIFQAAQHNEISSVLTIKMQVSAAYIAVLRLDGAVQVAQEHLSSLVEHQRDVKNLFDQDMVAKNDLLAANVEQANAQQLLLQANNQLDIAQAQYNQLLDRSLTDPVVVTPQFPQIPVGSLNELSTNALSQRPELLVLDKQIQALEQQAQSVAADSLPQVAVNGGYQYQENRYQSYEGLWMVNVGMQWKLFDGSTRHTRDAIFRRAVSLKEQRDDLSSTIGLQVRKTWLAIQEAQQRTEVTRLAITEADENLKVTTNRYKNGLATNTEVLRAEELRARTYDNFNNSNYDTALSTLQLRYAMGVL